MTKAITKLAAILAIASLTGCATLPGTARARAVRELNTVRLVALACHMFAADHGDMLPSTLDDLAPYLEGDFDLSQLELVASGKVSDFTDPYSSELVRSTSVSRAGVRAVAFVDGHCRLVPEE